MKHWRRTSSSPSSGSAIAAPRVLTVTAMGGGAGATIVFDRPVTWDGAGVGTMEIAGNWSQWIAQINATTLTTDTGATPGDAWDWGGGPDPSLTPTPDASQTGFVV